MSRFYDLDSQNRVLRSFLKDDDVGKNIRLLALNLQALRDELNKPISINIAYRPKWWELMQNRSGNSKHCLGMAADIVVSGMTPQEVSDVIEKLIKEGKMSQGGMGVYPSKGFVHYDIRGVKARWDG